MKLGVTLLALSASACWREPETVDVSAYAAEQMACVELARTSQDATACRERVRARYGRIDGGRD